jgi:hypothetical protein
MRPALLIALALVAAIPVKADTQADPNHLTPKEIAAGWLLVFDGETTFGWTVVPGKDEGKPRVEVKEGTLVIAGKQGGLRLNTEFSHFELAGEFRSSKKGSRLVLGLHGAGEKESFEKAEPLDEEAFPKWQKLTVQMSPGEIFITTNGDRRRPVELTVRKDLLGSIRFELPGTEEGLIELRNLKLLPLGEKPIFNGKDLEGWSINKADPKRMSSRWEVTADGELSLKTGPGDLVSEKQFGNFVLQCECKTLGKALNSGIFFRCIPGQYQNGYEAQIQNGYKDDDRARPADFGTGAIYRRIAARKVVSNDNEWFTLTVVAEGRHIATWVNGYQTVDWTDERPAHDNPRNGYREAKGPISIQGHDLTTNLLFRHIRVGELPEAKK